MEYGGKSLFDFIFKAHQLISRGNIDISEWHKVVKIIFKQMIECIEFIHKYSICHFDISLENFLICDNVMIQINKYHKDKDGDESDNESDRECVTKPKVTFILEDIKIKCCDFGLAHAFIQEPISQKQIKGSINNKWRSNKFVGKIGYKAPEIAARHQYFNAKSNDIFCVGVCLFMMLLGNAPWHIAHKRDPLFIHMFNGNIKHVINAWGKLHYVNDDLLDLIQSFFKYEDERICLKDIKNHPWLN